MSRIHEALKKAEQDRAAFRGGQAALESVRTSGAASGQETGEGNAGGESAELSAAAPVTGQVNLDTLLGRCAQGQWTPDARTMLFFSSDENAIGAEEFRTLRSRLYQMREKSPLKKVLVTSALPKEGKSFVAGNLAQVLARQHGRRALLIDADLRNARLHQALGTASSPGLSDYLLGESDEYSIMQRGAMENLFFIPGGRVASNPAELVANGRLKHLLQRVEPLFDWIIIDSPPAVPVSDAGLLANECDGVLMVVRSNATPFDVARKARQEFPDKALVGIVLNGIDRHTLPYSRYYYAAYGDQQASRKT